MADPNTQIDWWIAQTWQEAQGGADNDALVAWLHENGLTAVSSYTILQAALSCSPEEAKQMVFGHPVWADAEAGADLSAAEYTSDTLEPEPEPDATFGLDDWADEIEEDEPVYGEPGYQPPPTATPARATEGEEAPARSMLLDAYSEIENDEVGGGFDNMAAPEQPADERDDSFAAAEPEVEAPEPLESDEPKPVPDMEMEPAVSFEQEDIEDDEPEIDADQIFEAEPDWEAEPAAAQAAASEPAVAEPAPVASMVPPPMPAPQSDVTETASMAPTTDVPPSVEDAGLRPESKPAAPAPAAAAPPPILRMPPATPAERAATFAAAFGKKPAGAVNGSVAAEGPPSGSSHGGPPSNDTGPAAQAETAPAHDSTEPPQPETAAAYMPSPLALEPMPEIAPPPPVTPAEPLFTAALTREPAPAPPPFPAEKDEEPAAPTMDGAAVATDDESGDGILDEAFGAQANPAIENIGQVVEPDADEAPDLLETPLAESQPDSPDGRDVDTDLDVLPEEPQIPANPEDEEPSIQADDELPAIDWEEELPDLEIEEPDEAAETDDGGMADNDDAFGSTDSGGDGDEQHEEEGTQPRKRLLLDPAEEDQQSALPADEEPEDMSEVARKLGIDFRGVDPLEAGVDPELSKAAKELGISFRDDGDSTDTPQTPEDQTALEAQKLGISFREEDVSGKPPKPLIVKYLPMILGVIAIFFLLLLGATFSGTFIGWLRS